MSDEGTEEAEVEGLAADADLHAARNPPVNMNVATGTAANTAGAVNVAPPGGSGAGATGSNQAPAGGSPTWESGTGTAAPTLASISPTGAVSNSGDFSLTATGTGFLQTSVIVFNGTAQDTVYLSATQVRATIPNTSGATAGAKPVVVMNGPTSTAVVNCTYT